MPNILSVRKGQQTELTTTEATVDDWRQLVNGLPLIEGIVPLVHVLRPIYSKVVIQNLGALTANSVSAAWLDDTRLAFCVNYVDTLVRTVAYSVSLPPPTLSDDQNLTINFNPAVEFKQTSSTVGTPPHLSFSYLEMLSSEFFNMRGVLLIRALMYQWGNGERPLTTLSNYPISPLINTISAFSSALSTFTDFRNPKLLTRPPIKAPATAFVEIMDEYVLTIGGSDNDIVGLLPTDAEALRSRYLFRWSTPDTVDEWAPDLTNIPPQWFSGYLLLPTLGEVVDTFVAFGRVYVVMELGLVECTKLGGELGFSQRTLPLRFNLTFPAMGNCVVTSSGVLFVNVDGLHLFDGTGISQIALTSEGVFSLSFFSKILNLGVTYISTDSAKNPYLRGMFVPALNCAMWFTITSYDPALTNISTEADQPSTSILVYNYQTKATSTLQSPPGVLWFPLFGRHPGLIIYTLSTRACLFYTFQEQTAPNFIWSTPTAPIDWRTGFYKTKDSGFEFLVNRLFLEFDGLGWATVSVSVELYSSTVEVPFETIALGTLAEFTSTLWKDVRFSARYVAFVFTGNLTGGEQAVLRGIGIEATKTGSRW